MEGEFGGVVSNEVNSDRFDLTYRNALMARKLRNHPKILGILPWARANRNTSNDLESIRKMRGRGCGGVVKPLRHTPETNFRIDT